MKTVVILVTLLLFSGAFAETPNWVNDPYKVCKKSELCAVGEGTGLTIASSNAKAALAQIFETRITSKFKSDTTSEDGTMSEILSEELEEMTDEVLSGVTIKKRYESKTGFFVLASLSKRKAANRFKKEIAQIDEKMKTYIKDSSIQSAVQLKTLYKKREPLNMRYEFLTGFAIEPPISFEEIFKKAQKTLKNIVIAVDLKEDVSEELKDLISSSLINLGYRTTSADSKKATHVVSGEFKAEKQYLKVEGFEKYKFILALYASKKKGKKTGTINFTASAIGRNLKQAAGKIYPDVEEYIKEHIEELSFE